MLMVITTIMTVSLGLVHRSFNNLVARVISLVARVTTLVVSIIRVIIRVITLVLG